MTEYYNDPDPIALAADFRRKIAAGETVSEEECKLALAAIRTVRRQRSDSGKASKAKTGGKLDADALLNDLI